MSETSKATRAQIRIGGIEVDGFMLPDGEYRMSQTQIAECVQKDESNARKFLSSKAIKTLLGEGYTPGKNETIEVDAAEQTRGQTRIKPFSLEETSAFWLWEAYAIDDDLRRENEFLLKVLRDNNIDPYEIPNNE